MSDRLDVLIIGGGVSGAAIARALCRYRLRVALLEKENDVAMGATKANSAIVHGGYAEAHARLKGRLCYQGRRQFAALNQELNFGFLPIGSLVLAFGEGQKPQLEAMLQNGRLNGLNDLSILPGEQIRALEPNVNPAVKWALHCAGAGVCSPFEYTIALCENAVANGLQLYLNTPVTAIRPEDGGFAVSTASGAVFHTRFVVNAAGLAAAQVADMAGAGGFSIHPRSGEYIILGKGSGTLVNRVLFQMPTKMGKGILVTPTVYGNLIIGPDAIDEEKDDRSTHAERLYHIYRQALNTTNKIDLRRFLRSFAGVRAVANTDDFIIEHSRVHGFLNVAGIQSPGLTASPAVARMVCDLLAQASLSLVEKPGYDPSRRASYAPHEDLPPQALAPLLALPEGTPGRMVCRCQQVAEATLCDALRRGIPLNSVDAVKRRTTAGMGFCQGQFCRPRTAALLTHTYGRPIGPDTDAQRAGLHRVDRDEMLAYAAAQESP